jgi:hypothetical protein
MGFNFIGNDVEAGKKKMPGSNPPMVVYTIKDHTIPAVGGSVSGRQCRY